jgi:hypothetical protein
MGIPLIDTAETTKVHFVADDKQEITFHIRTLTNSQRIAIQDDLDTNSGSAKDQYVAFVRSFIALVANVVGFKPAIQMPMTFEWVDAHLTVAVIYNVVAQGIKANRLDFDTLKNSNAQSGLPTPSENSTAPTAENADAKS